MQREPAVRDCGFNGQARFLIAATGLSELLIDDGDRKATGVIGLDCIRQLKQFLLGGLGRPERSIFLEFHLGCMIAQPMALAGRFSPLGPRGLQVFSNPESISVRHASMADVRLSNSSPPTIFGASLGSIFQRHLWGAASSTSKSMLRYFTARTRTNELFSRSCLRRYPGCGH